MKAIQPLHSKSTCSKFLHLRLRLEPVRGQQRISLVPLPVQLSDNAILARLVLALGQLLQMHFIWSIGNTQRPDLRLHVGEGCILTDTLSTIRLHRTVNHSERSRRDEDFGLSNLLERGPGVALIDFESCV